ncbi:2-succinyl-5-enolpyruvyl-6-hydroxy-3-cyclohexene-1-carboxylic-acid synthase [Luethyella okanaganae]|uniref:2-succinyl-5-enolpyruvyl-6-hydroxy-3-cyclohexene-1-carboxylate synthase n=2 Tax=Luethyella okanaganae TaxID=69372 RepID=A0ABW1VJE3_9MICO
MSQSDSPATDFSFALLSEFVRLGVRHVVLCPGSRSQALALAAAELERVGALRLHVRIDERGAAFLGLGFAIETGFPALVVTTSGTAVANLHPAVLEAHHSGVPLVLLTADRPAELRGIRSNQTTAQPGLFGDAVRLCEDVPAPQGGDAESEAATDLAHLALAFATGLATLDPGPVHLNLALREPLSAAVTLDAARAVPAMLAEAVVADGMAFRAPAVCVGERDDRVASVLPIGHGPRTIVVAGHGAGAEAEATARAGGWPLLAEVSSGAHFGPNLVVAYRGLLGDADFGARVERAIVFGHPTLSREVPALLQRDGVETVVVSPTGDEWFNPGHRAQAFARRIDVLPLPRRSIEEEREARTWLGRWVTSSRNLVDAGLPEVSPFVPTRLGLDGKPELSAQREYVRTELAALRTPVTRRMLVDAVWRASWPHDRLVFGASRLIRDADRVVPGKRILAHANRGLAGIDGTVATALGIAIGSQAPGRADAAPSARGTTRVLLGDLTFLHDAGSLLLGAGESRPRIQLVVGNDGGGTIFDALEVAGTAPRAALDRVLYTPQAVDLAALAAAYGWEYALAETRGELDDALTSPPPSPSILEVPLPR